jgi:L-threonylcarbamoyladenylate synthase
MHSQVTMDQPHQSESAVGGGSINPVRREPSVKPDACGETKVLKVGPHKFGEFLQTTSTRSSLQTWTVDNDNSETVRHMETAAKAIRDGNYPVAFPTETVYGLGANARDSRAVQGIYKAKGRPSDNPLIVHVSDLDMYTEMAKGTTMSQETSLYVARYNELINKFWPGPLTLLFPKPPNYLAPEVTAGLDTVGLRMPDSALARTLIKLSGVPVAAPSANSSTKPSPTAAKHVLHDLNGKIQYILDGGPCNIGVESTVVDGLRDPPLILRPGGVGIDEIRECPGWENVQKGYKDESEIGGSAPRAPGMKYKHYSPNATVILCEDGFSPTPQSTPGMKFLDLGHRKNAGGEQQSEKDEPATEAPPTNLNVGILRTKHWNKWLGWEGNPGGEATIVFEHYKNETAAIDGLVELDYSTAKLFNCDGADSFCIKLVDVHLGRDTQTIASGLFAALREMDKRGVDVIFVEGIEEDGGGIAAAVMNRARKAASERWGHSDDGITKHIY